jgi:subtilisin family serine protease/subtilisin-like proprotein convertase family protein
MKTCIARSFALAVLATVALTSTGVHGAAAGDPATGIVHGETGEPGPGIYIVQLAGEPVATYRGGLPGLPATSPAATGARRLDPRSSASLAYESYLEDQQAAFLDRAAQRIGKRPDVRFAYRHALNGLALVLTPAQALALAGMEGVVQIERERIEWPATDAGPRFIGAHSHWGGPHTALGYRSNLTGSQVVPPTASAATGTGSFSFDVRSGQLSYSIATTGIASATGAALHEGAVGVAGPEIATLSHTTNPMVGVVTLTAPQRALLANGSVYVTVRTASHPLGEIRGQLLVNGKLGEGVLVGVLDSGINPGHPSFAEVAGDGYRHVNPFGAGNYRGFCVTNPAACNAKLVGMWALHPSSPDPADTDGHGSHTASTAAGNVVVDADFVAPTQTNTFPIVSGVAPRANLIAYQVCFPTCPGSSTTAAVNQAVLDGVDVINYSISGGTAPYTDSTAIAFRNAVAAGIVVSASAGNNGPGASTTNHIGPWVMTVGATTHDRQILNAVVGLTGGAGPQPDLIGEGPTAAFGPAPIVYAGAAPYNNPLCNPFPANTFTGQIVVCDRGVIGRVQKGINVQAAGGGGMILLNDLPSAASLNADAHVLPAVHLSHADGLSLKAWLGSGSGHSGRIGGGVVNENGPSDSMASFSSRGPALQIPDLLKPDLSAPGLNILAAYHAGFGPSPQFNIISGTSMSAPHVAGAAALLRGRHPTWTAPEIKSALMATATSLVTKEDGATPAIPFDTGAGRIDAGIAAKAGFVLNVTDAEFVAANPATGGQPRTLNLASLAHAACDTNCSWTRTVRSVLTEGRSYTATVVGQNGASGTVSPASFTLAAGGTQALTVNFAPGAAPVGAWRFGTLVIAPTGAVTPDPARTTVTANVGLDIPDNLYRGGFGGPTMACHTLSVSGLPAGSTVRQARIEWRASHTFVGDLVLKLRSPAGSILGLLSRPGANEPADDGGAGGAPFGDSANLAATHPIWFRDSGPKDAETMGDASTATDHVVCRDDGACHYRPNRGAIQSPNVLGALVGQAANGDWTLCAGDRSGSDTGRFEAWTLVLDYEPPVATMRLPIVVRNATELMFRDGFEAP